MSQSKQIPFRSGFISIVGRPNVGKSTLLNALVGEKVAIISPKPQTTRNQIIGIKTAEHYQMVFVDTPGIHKPRTKLGEIMNKTVQDAVAAIDALVLMADASRNDSLELETLQGFVDLKVPKFLVLNKVDLIPPQQLLPLIKAYADVGFEQILPMSALTGDGIALLEGKLLEALPEGPLYYPREQYTDQSERQIVAELIREQALFALQEEVPHGVGVEVLSMKDVSPTLVEIFADIYCDRASHKGIIIGKQGAMLGNIGSKARRRIETLLDKPVNLKLWVRVRPGWRDSLSDLRTLGYEE